jgi:hypothetical protein
MTPLEEMIRVTMVGTAAFAVIGSVFVLALHLWLKRQSAATHARVRERATRLNEDMLKILGGTAYINAVLMVGTLVLAVVGAIVLLGMSLFR